MSEKRVLSSLIVFALIVVAMYFINPLGAATLDPRARLLGHMLYRIPAGSMTPTLSVGDFIIVRVYEYATTLPKSGDVVVFKYPKDKSFDYVKRVIGTGGDKVVIAEGKLYRNGRYYEEPYVLPENNQHEHSTTMLEITVPEQHLFVLGDNRDNSNDSRFWGYVHEQEVVGKVVFIW